MWANAVTKHVLLVDEFIPYWPRLLGFHSLHVNAMKCIFVGFSLSKLQSFFWKISLNSRLIRLEGFNNKISANPGVCSTWPSGKPLTRCVRGPEFDSGHSGSILFFLFFFFCFSSFSFHFRYNSFAMFYSLQFWDLQLFFLGFICRSPEVFREVLQFTVLCKSRLHFFCTVLYVFLVLMLFSLSQLFALLALVCRRCSFC